MEKFPIHMLNMFNFFNISTAWGCLSMTLRAYPGDNLYVPFNFLLLTFNYPSFSPFSRSSSSLPHSRRITANTAALLRPAAAPTAAVFATGRIVPVHPPRSMRQRGENSANPANPRHRHRQNLQHLQNHRQPVKGFKTVSVFLGSTTAKDYA
jgi:hypothetical protein